jgi:3-oxoacyl-[acyl-carrier protein] reductase
MASDRRLAGQVALVTGAGKGIGQAIASAFAAAGAQVAVADVRVDAAEHTARTIEASGGRALALEVDVASAESQDQLFARLKDAYGRLDILVNNAGITHWGSVAQTSAEDFDRVVAVDARAPFLTMRAAADRLADGGRVINIASGVTAAAVPGIALYSGAKAFLDQITKVAAVEFAARGITVNAVAPGSTATGPFGQLTERQREEAGAAFALGRIGEPADTAAVVAFLASEEAGFVTGQVIYAAGGQRGPIRVGSLAG